VPAKLKCTVAFTEANIAIYIASACLMKCQANIIRVPLTTAPSPSFEKRGEYAVCSKWYACFVIGLPWRKDKVI
jgi:hypothetical protein